MVLNHIEWREPLDGNEPEKSAGARNGLPVLGLSPLAEVKSALGTFQDFYQGLIVQDVPQLGVQLVS